MSKEFVNMNSIESNFVPYQIALDMKSIGFDEPCLGKFYYNQLEIGGNWCNSDFKEDPDVFISAPLYQQAFRFFREKYDLQSNVSHGIIFSFVINNKSYEDFPNSEDNWFRTFEEAEFACLKKLIEIINQQ